MMPTAVLLPPAGARRCLLTRIDLGPAQGPGLPATRADSLQLRDKVSAQGVISANFH